MPFEIIIPEDAWSTKLGRVPAGLRPVVAEAGDAHGERRRVQVTHGGGVLVRGAEHDVRSEGRHAAALAEVQVQVERGHALDGAAGGDAGPGRAGLGEPDLGAEVGEELAAELPGDRLRTVGDDEAFERSAHAALCRRKIG